MTAVKFLGRSARALYAGLIAFVGATGALLTADMSLGDITTAQWFYIAGVTLAAAGGVWGFVNPTIK